MKSNTQLACVLLATTVVLTGCAQRRDCVDAQGNPRPDSECRRSMAGGFIGYPRYIYGGTLRNGKVVGGSTTPKSSNSVSRGGFGRVGSFGS